MPTVGNDDLPGLLAAARHAAHAAGATMVAEDVFGIPPPGTDDGTVWHCAETAKKLDWPATWLDGGPGSGSEPLSGVQVHAVKGVDVQRLTLGGRIVGSVFDDGFARHCRLGGLHAAHPAAGPEEQTRETFEFLEAALGLAGLDFSHVVRTWFYLDRILSWYGPFNRVRDRFFQERRVFDGLVPASTGVGGANPTGSVLMVDAYALQPHKGKVKIQAVPSPLQCPALAYGSSFSRAVEAAFPDHRRLWVSGTASIEPGGKTVHLDDMAGQIDQTMKVVAAILESRRMEWADVTRAIAYFKGGHGVALFREYCVAHGLAAMPVVLAEHDICRDDLLFEIELDAIAGP